MKLDNSVSRPKVQSSALGGRSKKHVSSLAVCFCSHVVTGCVRTMTAIGVTHKVGNEILIDFDEMCFRFTSDFSIGGDYGYLGFTVQFEATNDPYPSTYNLTIDDCDPVSADCIMVEFPKAL